MFKLFKKEKLLGTYVKYSLSTAKSNPEMIINEYTRILSKIDASFIAHLEPTLNSYYHFWWKKEFNQPMIKLKYKELEKKGIEFRHSTYKELANALKTVFELLEKRKEVEKELKQFRKQFQYKKYY